ncbi:conserved hypothetical protein [Ricinus communis]|uniref:non-specific serine/threonine protein kinase n=1 Tax=Ricinus communis TaxID=3988 RepID=B9RGQ6_RICCO|nr:conserved hypothetical protein [Ricinus communis]
MGGNMLAGEIPSSIGKLRNLRYGLNISNIGLVGHIPLELRGLASLISLDISSNNLTGSLEVLDRMQSLLKVNVSHNLFTGPIPETLMKMLNASPSSFFGNPGLCVNCLMSGGLNCFGNIFFRECDNDSNNGKALSRVQTAMIALGTSSGLCLLLGLAYFFLLCRKGQHQEVQDKDEPLLKQIMKATENLNERYIIGKGAQGAVFKAVLGPGNIFAAKKLEFAEQIDGNRSMVREIQTFEKIRHRNLVKVEEFWFKKDYGLILYKYMENGSLHDVLYKVNPPLKLEWSVRYNIALGTAHGLAYLH